jgi:citrate lyase beta subunit
MWAPRSLLFVPADQPRKVAKAVASGADAVIVDLEDAVAPARKLAARDGLATVVRGVDFSATRLLVRINAVGSALAQDDVLATLPANPAGYVLPKTETPEAVHQVRAWLHAHGAGERLIFPLIESALGILNLRDIVLTSGALAGLLFGGEDFVASIGAQATAERRELLYARSSVVTAAGAVGIPAVDTVFTAHGDVDGLRADAMLARQLGFAGKLLIHPAQVAVVNDVWRVDSAEIAAARALLAAYDQHVAQGSGVFSYQGRMVDEAIMRRARQVLARADAQSARPAAP